MNGLCHTHDVTLQRMKTVTNFMMTVTGFNVVAPYAGDYDERRPNERKALPIGRHRIYADFLRDLFSGI
jgi:hypothetical protein